MSNLRRVVENDLLKLEKEPDESAGLLYFLFAIALQSPPSDLCLKNTMAIPEIWLFVYILTFHFLLFGLRSWLLWRRTGVNPVTFRNKDNAHDWNGKLFTIITLLVTLTAALYAFGGRWYAFLVPIPYLETSVLHLAGWALMLSALPFIFIAQLHMGDSWRIGVDERERTALATHGLFRYSRNPIFAGILVSILGFFLVAPNALTLLLAGLSYASVQIQVRLEEEFLREQHGAAYESYCKEVRRWV